MTATFKVFITKDISEHPTFSEAFAAFFNEVKALLQNGTSWQLLETGCWIEGKFSSENENEKFCAPLYFYDARDFAFEVGLLADVDGKVAMVNPPPDIPLETIFLKFSESHIIQFESFRKLRERILELKTGA